MRVLFIVRDLEGAEPLGILYLVAVLRQGGHQVRLVGTRGVDLLAQVRAFSPQVIGYGSCTGQHTWYLKLNRALKRRHDFLAVLGGPHATFFPQVIEEDGVDVVCRGEGEQAMRELCDRLQAGQPIHDVANLWVKKDGKVTRNAPRALVADLDTLPLPDREARFDADPGARRWAAHSFLTSRGCPYSCAYCFNPSMQALYGPAWGRRRLRSPQKVVEEIEAVRRTTSLSFVQFRCSMFPDEAGWLEEFAELYRARVGLPFYCHVRADHMSERTVELLARAGCRSVNMGIECAGEGYRRDVLRRPMSDAAIRGACDRLHRHHIAILADNIVGLPGRSFADDLATLELNRECGVDYPLAMLLQPYPGTAIAEIAERTGAFNGDLSSIDFSYYQRSPLTFSSEAERRRIENLQKLFAVAVEAPALLPVVRRLVELPPNLVFSSLFRCWFLWCYHTRIMPHRLSAHEILAILSGVFGVYRREAFDDRAEPSEAGGGAGGGDRRGRGRGHLSRLLARLGTGGAPGLS
jgi:radical SAM superfamily enzyme YgiQ (UPF0313 family)